MPVKYLVRHGSSFSDTTGGAQGPDLVPAEANTRSYVGALGCPVAISRRLVRARNLDGWALRTNRRSRAALVRPIAHVHIGPVHPAYCAQEVRALRRRQVARCYAVRDAARVHDARNETRLSADAAFLSCDCLRQGNLIRAARGIKPRHDSGLRLSFRWCRYVC